MASKTFREGLLNGRSVEEALDDLAKSIYERSHDHRKYTFCAKNDMGHITGLTQAIPVEEARKIDSRKYK